MCKHDWVALKHTILNKGESFMTAILKVNPIQTELWKGLWKAQSWEGSYEKAYVGVREVKFGKRVSKRFKNTKIEHHFNQFHWRQQLLSGISKVTEN